MSVSPSPRILAVPEGIRLVFQPAHSPELQPAEHLWALVDEPLAYHCFATIESLDHAALIVAWLSLSSSTQSATIPSSIGGRVTEPGNDQPESVLRLVTANRLVNRRPTLTPPRSWSKYLAQRLNLPFSENPIGVQA
jgi:hypothetical protein